MLVFVLHPVEPQPPISSLSYPTSSMIMRSRLLIHLRSRYVRTVAWVRPSPNQFQKDRVGFGLVTAGLAFILCRLELASGNASESLCTQPDSRTAVAKTIGYRFTMWEPCAFFLTRSTTPLADLAIVSKQSNDGFSITRKIVGSAINVRF